MHLGGGGGAQERRGMLPRGSEPFPLIYFKLLTQQNHSLAFLGRHVYTQIRAEILANAIHSFNAFIERLPRLGSVPGPGVQSEQDQQKLCLPRQTQWRQAMNKINKPVFRERKK